MKSLDRKLMTVGALKCKRCQKETNCFTMSMFNTQEICMDCKEAEKKHPEYKRARDAELQAVKGGDYNFKGIGYPDDK